MVPRDGRDRERGRELPQVGDMHAVPVLGVQQGDGVLQPDDVDGGLAGQYRAHDHGSHAFHEFVAEDEGVDDGALCWERIDVC